MKRFVRLLVFALAMLLMLSTLAACNKTDPTPDESSSEETPAPVPQKDPLTLTSDYVVVRPENCSDEVKAATLALKDLLCSATGGNVLIKEDILSGNMKPSEYEILVGQTNREESANVLATIKYNDFAVTIEGKKLVICAYNDEKLIEAIAYISTVIENAGDTLVFSDADQKTVRAEYPLDDVKFGDVSLKGYTIVIPSGTNDIVKAQANKLQQAICALSGDYLPIISDSKSETDKEILLDDTCRAASAAVDTAALGENGYVIKADGNKMVVKTNDKAFSFMKTLNNIIADAEDGVIEASEGRVTVSDNTILTAFCFTDVHNNFAMLEPTNDTGDYVVRKNVDQMIDHLLDTKGAVDLVLVGGDLMSDYPNWNESGNLPYKYFVEYRELLVDTFARLSKEGKVSYCAGNHDYAQGEGATDCPDTENGNYNSSDFYFGAAGMKQGLGELAEKDMFWKIGEHTGDKYLIGYYYKVNGIHVLGLAPDPDHENVWAVQGTGFSDESIEWLDKKLDEIDPYGTEIIFVNCHYPMHVVSELTPQKLFITEFDDMIGYLTDAFEGHSNLFHFFGHRESMLHSHSSRAVLHYNNSNTPIMMDGNETDSSQLLAASSRSFTSVNMGHFRSNYSRNPGYFGTDVVTGYGGYSQYGFTHGSTATPTCAQGMYVEVYEDRIVFTMKNIGTFKGFSTEDLFEPYTVWLYK